MLKFQFESLADFFAMSGYAFYVWSAYAFFAIVLGINLWLPYRRRVQLMKLLQARQLRQQDPGTHADALQQSSQQ